MAEAVTYDYRKPVRGWGHDIGFSTKDKGITLDAHGWGPQRKATQALFFAGDGACYSPEYHDQIREGGIDPTDLSRAPPLSGW